MAMFNLYIASEYLICFLQLYFPMLKMDNPIHHTSLMSKYPDELSIFIYSCKNAQI